MEEQKKIIISSKDDNDTKDIVLTILNDKSEKEIKNYVYIKIIICLIILSKDYNDSSPDFFDDSFEFFEENSIFLTKNSIDFIKSIFFYKDNLSDEILDVYNLSKEVLFDNNWRDEIINNSKSWCLIQEKSKMLLSILKISANATFDEYEDLLDESIIG